MAIEAKTPNRRGGKRAAVTPSRADGGEGTVVAVLAAISVCHMLNDVIQSLIMAIYPMLKSALQLDFSQIGIITFTFQGTASLLQPVVGYYTDRYPTPYSLVLGMSSSLIGLLLMAFATNYLMVLAAAALIGMGSSVFHPESSRVARLASGGRHGLAQSVFQVGGNFGTAHRTAARGLHRAALRADEPRLVLPGGARRHGDAHRDRRLVRQDHQG